MKKIRKNKIFFIFAIFIIILLIFIVLFRKTDGMEQSGIVNAYYRVHTKQGWSNWSKNGLSNKNLKDNIDDIELRISKDKFTKVDKFISGKWYENDIEKNKEKKNINAIKITNDANFLRKYDVCYRTYNSKNKWLNWSCNGKISGNAKEIISGLEVKVIPKNVIKSEYLKDYIENNNKSSVNF